MTLSIHSCFFQNYSQLVSMAPCYSSFPLISLAKLIPLHPVITWCCLSRLSTSSALFLLLFTLPRGSHLRQHLSVLSICRQLTNWPASLMHISPCALDSFDQVNVWHLPKAVSISLQILKMPSPNAWISSPNIGFLQNHYMFCFSQARNLSVILKIASLHFIFNLWRCTVYYSS